VTRRLSNLPNRVQEQRLTRVTTERSAGHTQRQRGRGWMERRAKWLRLNPLCKHCLEHGQAKPATQLDHVVPLFQGGLDDESNFQSLCTDHHQAKTTRERKTQGTGGRETF
jgi:5-methylcytosine-specific restriction endonuclease McrA